MEKSKQQEYKKKLLERKAQLESGIAKIPDYEEYGSDEGDNAMEVETMESNKIMKVGMNKSLSEVGKALVAMDEGKYGQCLQCGTAIPEGRLEVKPASIYCIECEKEI